MAADDERDDAQWSRRSERFATSLQVDVRQQGPARIPATITNLSTTGFHLQADERLRRNSRIWVRIGSLAPLMAQVIWNDACRAGCAFSQPLHPAILDHIIATPE